MHHIRYTNIKGQPEHIKYPAASIASVFDLISCLKQMNIKFNHYFID